MRLSSRPATPINAVVALAEVGYDLSTLGRGEL
jgi:hypothetical protein